jgi:hypothetical protein
MKRQHDEWFEAYLKKFKPLAPPLLRGASGHSVPSLPRVSRMPRTLLYRLREALGHLWRRLTPGPD